MKQRVYTIDFGLTLFRLSLFLSKKINTFALMSKLYPLHFKTIYKEKIWGGNKLKNVLGKELPSDQNYGESWELSAVPDNVSVVSTGTLRGKSINQLVSTYKGALVGEKNYERFGDQFPILIKFLDANKDLSLQVHPDDKYAKKHFGNYAQGKAEMWYVMHADKNAELFLGFSKDLEKEEFFERIQKSKLEEVLNKEKVVEGDVFFVPPGRIHNIGKGMMIAEVQQTSDLTYRIYDFDRTDKDGRKRELHLEKAAEVLDYKAKDKLKTQYNGNEPKSELVDNNYFTINKCSLTSSAEINYTDLDSFVILVGIRGSMQCKANTDAFEFNAGDVYLLPAETNRLIINCLSKSEFLEVFIR